MATLPETRDDAIIAERTDLFIGPIPPPAVLQGYVSIDPSIPNRIITMAEKLNDAEVSKSNRWSFTLAFGQIMSFTIGLVGIAACVLLALKGLEGGAIAAIAGGFTPMVIAALSNLKNKKE
jgi:uncharacterized membrane protein